jgi:hypothetical protein
MISQINQEDKMRDLKEIAKDTRKALKVAFPKCKFSVTIERYSMGQNMGLTLMASDFMPFIITEMSDMEYEHGHLQVNHYYIERDHRITDKAKTVLMEACKIANRENYDNSDSQTDYFDVGFYFDLNIGKWDKSFRRVA